MRRAIIGGALIVLFMLTTLGPEATAMSATFFGCEPGEIDLGWTCFNPHCPIVTCIVGPPRPPVEILLA